MGQGQQQHKRAKGRQNRVSALLKPVLKSALWALLWAGFCIAPQPLLADTATTLLCDDGTEDWIAFRRAKLLFGAAGYAMRIKRNLWVTLGENRFCDSFSATADAFRCNYTDDAGSWMMLVDFDRSVYLETAPDGTTSIHQCQLMD